MVCSDFGQPIFETAMKVCSKLKAVFQSEAIRMTPYFGYIRFNNSQNHYLTQSQVEIYSNRCQLFRHSFNENLQFMIMGKS